MPSWEQSRQDFESLCQMWEKAQQDQIFSDNMNPRNKNYNDPHAVNNNTARENEIEVWRDISSSGISSSVDGDGSLLMEDFERVESSVEKKPKYKTRKRKVKKLANQPNKIAPDTIDSDTVDDSNRVKVTAGFDSDPNFDDLVNLHHKKYEKEVERNKAYPNDEKKLAKIEKELKKLRDEIAKLSNRAYGTYTDNEYYT